MSLPFIATLLGLSPTAVWPFNDSGSTALDIVGGFNGAIGATWTQDTSLLPNQGDGYDNSHSITSAGGTPGASTQITVPNNTALNPTSKLSIGGLYRFTGGSAATDVNLMANSYPASQPWNVLVKSNFVLWQLNVGGISLFSSTALVAGTLYLIVVTFDGTLGSNSVKIYINGSLDNQGGGSATITGYGGGLTFGQVYSEGPIYTTQKYQNWFEFSGTVLSPTDVSNLWTATSFTGGVSGIGAAVTGNTTAAGVGKIIVAGVGAAAAAGVTANGIGKVTIAGTGAGATAAATANGVGKVTVTGTGVASTGAATANGVGVVANPVSGSGAAAASGVTANGAGKVTVAGTGAAAAAAVTANGVGVVGATPIVGSGAATASGVTAAGVGKIIVAGVGAAAAAGVTANGIGKVTIAGTGAGATAAATANGVGKVTIAGSGAAATAGTTASGSGHIANPVTGSGAGATAGTTASGHGIVITDVAGVGAAATASVRAHGIGHVSTPFVIPFKVAPIYVALSASAIMLVQRAQSGFLNARPTPLEEMIANDGPQPFIDAGTEFAAEIRVANLDVAVSWSDTLEVLTAGASRLEAKIPI